MVSRRAAVLSAVMAAASYAVLWLGTARGWGWLTAADDAALANLHAFGADRAGWVSVWNAISMLLSPTAMRVAALVGIGVSLWRRQPRIAVFLAAAVLLMGLVTVVAKALADRPRPGTAFVVAASSSFPSGHALGATAAALAFLAVGWPLQGARARRWALAGAVAAIVAVGASRIVLNVHHPSDVLAGWALGYLWFLACVTLLPPQAGPRGQDSGPPAVD